MSSGSGLIRMNQDQVAMGMGAKQFMEDLESGRFDPEIRERQRQYRETLVERPRFGGRPFENIEAGAVVYAPESPVAPEIAPVEMDDQQVAMELSLPRGASYMRRAAPADARVPLFFGSQPDFPFSSEIPLGDNGAD